MCPRLSSILICWGEKSETKFWNHAALLTIGPLVMNAPPSCLCWPFWKNTYLNNCTIGFPLWNIDCIQSMVWTREFDESCYFLLQMWERESICDAQTQTQPPSGRVSNCTFTPQIKFQTKSQLLYMFCTSVPIVHGGPWRSTRVCPHCLRTGLGRPRG